MQSATVLVVGDPDAIRPYLDELSTRWLTIGRSAGPTLQIAALPPSRREDVVVELESDGSCVVRLSGEQTRLHVWPSPRDLAAIVALVVRLAELDRQLRVMDEMEPLGVLACSVAHDVNNLLVVVLTSLSEVMRSAPQTAPTLKGAETAVQRIATLMKRMLSFGREGSARSVDLNSTVTELLPTLRSVVGTAIVVRESLSAGLPRLQCDVVAIEQVLVNLCANARDALPLGGTIRISTRVESDPGAAQEGGGRPSRQWLVLEVCDDGTGMLPETLARAFEPLFTTKPPGRGTGLGLKSVRRIVSRAGGSINLSSKPGQGTTVTLRWPA